MPASGRKCPVEAAPPPLLKIDRGASLSKTVPRVMPLAVVPRLAPLAPRLVFAVPADPRGSVAAKRNDLQPLCARELHNALHQAVSGAGAPQCWRGLDVWDEQLLARAPVRRKHDLAADV